MATLPYEAEPILVIDPDATLTGTISLQVLESVSQQGSQVVKRLSCIEPGEFHLRPAMKLPWQHTARRPRIRSKIDIFRAPILERLDCHSDSDSTLPIIPLFRIAD